VDARQSEERLRDRLESQGRVLLRISGTSMLPTFYPGDLVRVVCSRTLRVGDVVTFSLRRRLYTHRIVKIADGMVFCRGDNLIRGDAGVPASAVLGRAVEIVGRGPVLPLHPVFSYVGLRRVLRAAGLRLAK
jgi:phage repressor protein C with HTH and peptisase S24 domain